MEKGFDQPFTPIELVRQAQSLLSPMILMRRANLHGWLDKNGELQTEIIPDDSRYTVEFNRDFVDRRNAWLQQASKLLDAD